MKAPKFMRLKIIINYKYTDTRSFVNRLFYGSLCELYNIYLHIKQGLFDNNNDNHLFLNISIKNMSNKYNFFA